MDLISEIWNYVSVLPVPSQQTCSKCAENNQLVPMNWHGTSKVSEFHMISFLHFVLWENIPSFFSEHLPHFQLFAMALSQEHTMPAILMTRPPTLDPIIPLTQCSNSVARGGKVDYKFMPAPIQWQIRWCPLKNYSLEAKFISEQTVERTNENLNNQQWMKQYTFLQLCQKERTMTFTL